MLFLSTCLGEVEKSKHKSKQKSWLSPPPPQPSDVGFMSANGRFLGGFLLHGMDDDWGIGESGIWNLESGIYESEAMFTGFIALFVWGHRMHTCPVIGQ